MIAHKKSKKFDPEEDETAYFETEFKMCRRCKQEYTGSCPISSASCPMEAEEKAAGDDDEEDSDFDDVGNVDAVLTKDKDADAITDEEGEIPPEDLEDDD
jgi:hypothetical protein